MALFTEFISQQWMLATSLLVLIMLLALHESRKGAKALTPQQVSNLMNKESAVVIDIREKGEYTAGHIVGAIHIPHAKMVSRIAELEKYKDRPIVLTCKYGQHAGATSKLLTTAGFEQVYKLGGGIAEWQNSQMPLVKA